MKFSLREKVLGKKYCPLNTIWVSKSKLTGNYKYLKSLNRKIKVAPVLKSNAYGHGLLEVAHVLDQEGAPFFSVDSLYEAHTLIKSGIKTPILIMGYVDPENLKPGRWPFSYVSRARQSNLIFAVWDLKLLNILNKYQPGAKVHIFVDTGMNREGVEMEYFDWYISQTKKLPNIKVEGLMSHLAEAEEPDSPLTKLQIKNFKKALEILNQHGIKPKWTHILNSAGLLSSGLHTRCVIGNIARVGRGLYGVDPTNNKHPRLQPVLKFTTKLVQIKRVKKGERVGYDGTFKAEKDMLIGVLPAGFYDGVDRRLSNEGVVLIKGKVCQVVGRVSMNITTVDLSQVEKPFIGQEVVIYSDNPTDPNCLKKAAEACQTIPYELLVHEASSTRREIS